MIDRLLFFIRYAIETISGAHIQPGSIHLHRQLVELSMPFRAESRFIRIIADQIIAGLLFQYPLETGIQVGSKEASCSVCKRPQPVLCSNIGVSALIER